MSGSILLPQRTSVFRLSGMFKPMSVPRWFFLPIEPDSAGPGPHYKISFLDICKERPRSVYHFPLYSHICQQTAVNIVQ